MFSSLLLHHLTLVDSTITELRKLYLKGPVLGWLMFDYLSGWVEKAKKMFEENWILQFFINSWRGSEWSNKKEMRSPQINHEPEEMSKKKGSAIGSSFVLSLKVLCISDIVALALRAMLHNNIVTRSSLIEFVFERGIFQFSFYHRDIQNRRAGKRDQQKAKGGGRDCAKFEFILGCAEAKFTWNKKEKVTNIAYLKSLIWCVCW